MTVVGWGGGAVGQSDLCLRKQEDCLDGADTTSALEETRRQIEEERKRMEKMRVWLPLCYIYKLGFAV